MKIRWIATAMVAPERDVAEWSGRGIGRSRETADHTALALEIAELAILQCGENAGVALNRGFCLGKADGCDEAAVATTEDRLRREWLQMADDWRLAATLPPNADPRF